MRGYADLIACAVYPVARQLYGPPALGGTVSLMSPTAALGSGLDPEHLAYDARTRRLAIGHFPAAGFDALAYLREHHRDITNLHLKDRKKNQGDNTPWGEGDTPIREVLQLLKRERWPIRAYIEYEHRGESGPVDEVKKCFAFARNALA